MKKYLNIGLVLAIAGMVTTIIVQYRIVQQEKTKQIAVENPAKTEATEVERVIIKTVDKKGDPVVEVREVIRSLVVSKPEIPANSERYSLYYVGCSAGSGLGTPLAFDRYGVSAGINLTESLSVGLYYQRAGNENYVGAQLRINF